VEHAVTPGHARVERTEQSRAAPGHGHTHGALDASLLSSRRGIWAIKWSVAGLGATALAQAVVVAITGSAALLADTIHNIGDAATALPLWAAFRLGIRPPTKRFTYGYGRFEDLAGVVIVIVILASAAAAGYTAIDRLLHPEPVTYLWAVAAASIIGFAGNEAVAFFRIKVGKEIGSAALIADGYHARVDGLTSLAVLLGAAGVWLGYPWADPVVGLVITAAILKIVWDSGKSVFVRLLDGVDSEVVDDIRHTIGHVEGVHDVTEVRVRWLGHRMHAEVNVAVDPGLSVTKGHDIAVQVQHDLLHELRYLASATIHVDPWDISGEHHHRPAGHTHDDMPTHSH
jgi:cation diffusion facilitator family transporter